MPCECFLHPFRKFGDNYRTGVNMRAKTTLLFNKICNGPNILIDNMKLFRKCSTTTTARKTTTKAEKTDDNADGIGNDCNKEVILITGETYKMGTALV